MRESISGLGKLNMNAQNIVPENTFTKSENALSKSVELAKTCFSWPMVFVASYR